ncbi:MAG: NERD domain-containing protein [Proteobacteria bacterium]|nr:NERD domain-containing protein [Pseudomonadota bacterium]
MAILIPNRASCLPRMTNGERRLAQRLEELLEDDYLVWYDVPVGLKQRHPDFLILHPNRGFLVLEVKDWKLETVVEWDRISVTLLTDRGQVHEVNPLSQARSYAHELVGVLQKDPALRCPDGHLHAGKLLMPYGIGVVLTNITRAQFDANEIGNVIPPHKVICRDEMTEGTDSEEFQERLWAMFDAAFPCHLSLPQIDRFRHHVFPEVRISAQASQGALFSEASDCSKEVDIPDLIRVMDLQQELLARSLGDGHRVIHGVAGSGKTMILGYRCMHLAKALAKPILVLCYNKTLAARLNGLIVEKGLGEKVVVQNFHAWCYEMLRAYSLPKPQGTGEEFFAALVEAVIAGVESKAIPRAQYGAVMIDEGHDFEPEWFKLIVQMVDPYTNSLLVLYDDAQSIYAGKRKAFSFSSVGIEARGRTTILKLNYRNTLEVLTVARTFAQELLAEHASEEDGIPLLAPQSAGRRGPMPQLIHCETFSRELDVVVSKIRDAIAQGRNPNDIAILYRNWSSAQAIAGRLQREDLPFIWAQGKGKAGLFDGEASIKLITLHSSKGLEFGLVIIPEIGSMPTKNEAPEDEARLLYVGMTRALNELVITYHGESNFVEKLEHAVSGSRRSLEAA